MRDLQMAFNMGPMEITALLVLLSLLIWYVQRPKRKVVSKAPPGPSPWPLIGNLNLIGSHPHYSLAALAKKYGSIMGVKFGSVPVLVISSSEAARELFKNHDKNFAARPRMAAGEILGFEYSDIGFMSYGPVWRALRKLFAEKLIHANCPEKLEKIRKEEVHDILHSTLEFCREGKTVRIRNLMENLMMNTVTRLTTSKSYFGSHASASFEEGREMMELFEELLNLVGVVNIGDFIPFLKPFDLQGHEKRMWITRRKMDAAFQSTIDDHRLRLKAGGEIRDFVDELLSSEKEFADKQIKALLLDTVVASAHTTSATFERVFAELIRHPHIMEKVQREIDSVVGLLRLVEESDLPKLKYLHLVIKESFRLNPIGPLLIPHESVEKCTVAGFEIPAKTRLIVNIWTLQRDPLIWEDPEQFIPERFEKLPELDLGNLGRDYKVLPFGVGRRMCPGYTLASVAIQILLATLVHACNWSLPDGQRPEDLDMAETFGSTCFRKVPLDLIATSRLPADSYKS